MEQAKPNEMLFEDDIKYVINEATKNVQRFMNMLDIARGKYVNKRGVTPYEVIYQKNRFRILHYLSDHPKHFRTPILFTYALINRYYVLDISEDKSLVRYLLEKGFDVYMVDWGTPSRVEGRNSISDYIQRYLKRGVEAVRKFSREDQINLFGYCLGSMMSIIYTAAYQKHVKNLILLTPPVDFEGDEGVLSAMTNEKYLDTERITRYFKHLIPSNFMQAGFDFKNIVGTMMTPNSLWSILWNKKALDNYFPMDHWVHDNTPISAQYWHEYIRKFYVQNSFMKNDFSLNGRKLNFKDIVCPVLSIAADKDDIVTLKCAEGSMKIIGSKDKTMMVKRGGHVGVINGSRAKNEVWPDIYAWLSKRSEHIISKKGGTIALR